MKPLSASSAYPSPEGPVVFVVMDGVGEAPAGEGNAVALARTPNLDELRTGPFTTVRAHGTAVGLPSDEDMGNSEVGHNALGAGRVFAQGAKLVNEAIQSGRLFEGKAWRQAVDFCKPSGALHLLGLLSDGNVHSHIDHVEALIERADQVDVQTLFVHILLDGRDVGETTALEYIERLEKWLSRFPERDYRIASGGGRMKVTMDRYEADWEMVELGWKTHVLGQGEQFASASEAIHAFRERIEGVIDQNLPPFVIGEGGRPVGPIGSGDSVILFNFRGDRAIEISKAFEQEDFPCFDRGPRPEVFFAGMMEYDGDQHIPGHYLVEPPLIERTMGEYLAKTKVSQWACSETQKFGHVTFFWNGNRSGFFDAAYETYLEIPSDRRPFEERPWMKAAEITDATVQAIESGKYRFLRINLANGDMVGHTGHREAAVVAVEAVDLCIGRLKDAVRRAGGVMLVTADHGNADEMYMLDKEGSPKLDERGRPSKKTSHTLSAVPVYLYDPSGIRRLNPNPRAGLANLSATALELLGFQPPGDYEPSLLARG